MSNGTWWQRGVFYQIYPRSFCDTTADGIGDLPGMIEKLDYLEWLGVDGIWVNPVTPSPNHDWGYDVSDYCCVHPELGTLEHVDELIREAHRRNIRVLMDFVPNHTSSDHEWFRDAASARDSVHRTWYIWGDPKEDGSPPNNWLSTFGGSAWTWDEKTGQYYLHNFLPSQPDLNWWEDGVRAAMDDVLRFWWDRGVDGFRIDVAHAVIQDKDLRDNLPLRESAHPREQRLGQESTYNMNQPEVHDIIRRWRQIAQAYDPERLLVGETFVLDLARMAQYYGTGDELHLAFNFVFVFQEFDAKLLRATVEQTLELLPQLAWPCWTGSNHDVLRFPTRWCDNDERKARLALMMLLTLRGTPFLYYGDEICMGNTPIERGQVLDPVGKRFWPEDKGRDAGRTPMPWSARDGAGFTEPGVTPWLPLGDVDACNVEDQRDDPGSALHLTRDLIMLRKDTEDLASGDYRSLDSPHGVWAYGRGSEIVVVLNFSDERVDYKTAGTVLVATTRAGEGAETGGNLTLEPWCGAVIRHPGPDADA